MRNMSLLNIKMGKKIMSNVHDLLNMYLNINHEGFRHRLVPGSPVATELIMKKIV